MRRLSLVGYRACGKSTLGELVASRLGLPFVDLDARITTRIGGPINGYFASHGEPAFRALEQQELAETLEKPGDLVLATGGGCVLREENRGILRAKGGVVVYLAVNAGELQRRLRHDDGGRPSLTGATVADEVPRILALREPLYRAVSHTILDGAQPPEVLLEALVQIVENYGQKSDGEARR
jgi:shikimate kinase